MSLLHALSNRSQSHLSWVECTVFLQIKLIEKPLPKIELDGDVTVAVEMTSICGTGKQGCVAYSSLDAELHSARIGHLCADLHPYRGEKPGLDEGTTMAHEMVGTIKEVSLCSLPFFLHTINIQCLRTRMHSHQVGNAVRSLKVGQRVVSAFTTCCGSCWFCRHKLTCRCEHDLGARCYG